MKTENTLLELNKVSVGFAEHGSIREVTHEVSLKVNRGEIIGIVGESGSGKSVSMLAALGLLAKNGRILTGNVCFYNKKDSEQYIELSAMTEHELCQVRGDEISMIFQEPMTSLNPLMTIGRQVEEMLVLHSDCPKEERRERVLTMLSEAELKDTESLYGKYPHQLSGGMRQRVMIAMAMLMQPKLLIADEPTTALDVTIQAKILALLKKFRDKYGTAIILISHDLGVIRSICSRAAVMCGGRIVEQGETEQLFSHPQEEYTKQLLHAATGKNLIPLRELADAAYDTAEANRRVLLHLENFSAAYLEDKPKHKKASGNTERTAGEKLSGRLHQFLSGKQKRQVVEQVSFDIYEGEIVGIVGESGCGKSTLTKAIAGLNALTEGTMELYCEQPQMVFQDPFGSLNPSKTIGWLLEEPLRLHKLGSRQEQRSAACGMLEKVGLPAEYYDRYPGTLSGGQRQRIAIAMAIMLKRKLILLDEPVSALDVTVQEQILTLLLKLQQEFGLSYLFISHDMNVVSRICDRVLVMYNGRIVESGRTREIFEAPKHEYTKHLLKARL